MLIYFFLNWIFALYIIYNIKLLLNTKCSSYFSYKSPISIPDSIQQSCSVPPSPTTPNTNRYFEQYVQYRDCSNMLSKIKCNDQNGVLDKAAATQRFSLPGAPFAPQLVSDSMEKSGKNHHQQYNCRWAVIAVVVVLLVLLLFVPEINSSSRVPVCTCPPSRRSYSDVSRLPFPSCFEAIVSR